MDDGAHRNTDSVLGFARIVPQSAYRPDHGVCEHPYVKKEVLRNYLYIVNDIRNFVFGLAGATVYGFCKSRKQKFVMSFIIFYHKFRLFAKIPVHGLFHSFSIFLTH